MSDFCLECLAEMRAPKGWSDFKGIPPGEMVLCEGCGFIEVDIHGKRVAYVPEDDPLRLLPYYVIVA